MEMKKNFVINAAFYAIVAALAVVGWKYLLPVMMPFVIGFVVASIVQMPLNRLKLRKPGHRKPAAVVLCVVFYTLLVGLVVLFFAKVITEIGHFAASLPDLFQEHLLPFFWWVADRVEAVLAPFDSALAEWIIELGKTAATTLAKYATEFSGWAVKAVASGAVSIPNVLLQIIITVVSSFYIAADYRTVTEFLKKLIPEAQREFVVQVIRYAKTAVWVYVKSYSIMFCITFVELWAGFGLLDLEYALGLAFGIAVFDLMPILGVGGILLPWGAVALVMGKFKIAIGVVLLYVVIAAVRHTLEPRIVGKQIGLHPLATLVAMIVGLRLAGLVGMMLLPVTLVAVMKLREGSHDPQSVKTEG